MASFWGIITSRPWVGDLLAISAGLLVPLAFAPFEAAWVLFPALALFFATSLSISPGRAFWRGWLFGLAQFGWGVTWIYYSLHLYSSTPAPLAIAIAGLFAAFLALFPAVATYVAVRISGCKPFVLLCLALPAAWVLAEWVRGLVFSGFPWLLFGYSQVETPLAGYAPVVGVLGLSWIVAICASLLLVMVMTPARIKGVLTVVLGVIWLSGWALAKVDWTHPVGEAIKVSLLQASISQDQKWQPDLLRPTMEWYRQQTEANWDSQLIIWPETALPAYLHHVKPYVDVLGFEAEKYNSNVLIGLFIKDLETDRYYNSVVSARSGDDYKKRRLVLLGEYFPFREQLAILDRWIRIPKSDIDFGPQTQSLIRVNGQPLGISICFEDAFSSEIRKSLPQATLLVNVSNDAWFYRSIQPYQHHQIARMRALEAGRYMLRATNTGVSSIIGPKGEEVVMSPLFEPAVVTANAQPMMGATPFVTWGNTPLIIGLLVILLVPILRSRRVVTRLNQ